jgi:hypothetical protein
MPTKKQPPPPTVGRIVHVELANPPILVPGGELHADTFLHDESGKTPNTWHWPVMK